MFRYIFMFMILAHSGISFPLLERSKDAKGKNSHWVNIWTTMPQLVEPANLPPVPFVRYHSTCAI